MSIFFSSENNPENNSINPPITVLELFTSQGCSSCPPADELLSKVQKREHVIALSYHVDYWNYIGWKDPFSQEAFSNKQRKYSQKFNSSSIYTPQVVVNGREHFVGSDASKMNSKLDFYGNILAENIVKISEVNKKEDVISFQYDVEGDLKGKSIRIVLVIKERTTKIGRGENRNRTLKNANIVVSEKVMSLNASRENHSIAIPNLVNEQDDLKLIAIVENENLDIVGAKEIDL